MEKRQITSLHNLVKGDIIYCLAKGMIGRGKVLKKDGAWIHINLISREGKVLTEPCGKMISFTFSDKDAKDKIFFCYDTHGNYNDIPRETIVCCAISWECLADALYQCYASLFDYAHSAIHAAERQQNVNDNDIVIDDGRHPSFYDAKECHFPIYKFRFDTQIMMKATTRCLPEVFKDAMNIAHGYYRNTIYATESCYVVNEIEQLIKQWIYDYVNHLEVIYAYGSIEIKKEWFNKHGVQYEIDEYGTEKITTRYNFRS